MDKYVTYYFYSVFWGLVLALISLPLYLGGIGIPAIGQRMGIDSFIMFMIPLSAAFLIAMILSDTDMVYSVVAVLSGLIFLSILFLVFVSYPAIVGSAYALDYYYVDALKKLFLMILMVFPSFFIGGIVGKIVGERYISEQTKKEREELNKRMKEWKETLERVLEEKLEEELEELKGREKGN